MRGRPRKIDPDQALDAAMLTFWEKGYDATSMSDLVDATGMAKPGLYATFGDKETIYKKALENYVSIERNAHLAEILTSSGPAKETFRKFFNTLADTICDPTTPDGCFLVNTLTKSANDEPAIKEMALKFNKRRKDGFRDYLNHAKSVENLSKNNDVDQLADFLAAQVMTLAVLQKTGSTRQQLSMFIETALTIFRD